MKTKEKTQDLLFMMVLGFSILMPDAALSAPTIKIDKLCAYSTKDCYITGQVYDVNFSDYKIAPYIKVDEVWWTKPYWSNPACPIDSAGKFKCYVTTGGSDLYFTAIKLFLLPKATVPKSCGPCEPPPTNPSSVAVLNRERPFPRTLVFSGYRWRVKKAMVPSYKLGPGTNYFSDSVNDVWVDNEGLHLKTRQILSHWYSTEVILQRSLGYGTYIIQTKGRIDKIDPNAVLGFFTWDSQLYHPTHREMDIEFSKWGNANNPENGQFLVQKTSNTCDSNNCSRFAAVVPEANTSMTHYIVWKPEVVEFSTYEGQYLDNPPEIALVHRWAYTGLVQGMPIPKQGKENIRFNLWLFEGKAPLSGQSDEVIIEKFAFQPLCPPDSQSKLAIGDPHQGGIIFRIEGCGDHGLIAAPSDQGSPIRWWNGRNVVTGATGTAIGTGQENTHKIIEAQGTGNYAASLTDNLELNGYSDWYLPSKDELNLMYNNIGPGALPPLTNIGGFSRKDYWSSTEDDKYFAWVYRFGYGGYEAIGNKNIRYSVRAVRSF